MSFDRWGVINLAVVGSSFVERGGCGFWVSDSVLEIWLLALVREIDMAVESESAP